MLHLCGVFLWALNGFIGYFPTLSICLPMQSVEIQTAARCLAERDSLQSETKPPFCQYSVTVNGVTVLLWESCVALQKISALPTRTCAVSHPVWVRLQRKCSSLQLRLGKIIIKRRKHVDTIIGSQNSIQQLHYSAEIIIMIVIYCFIIQPKVL